MNANHLRDATKKVGGDSDMSAFTAAGTVSENDALPLEWKLQNKPARGVAHAKTNSPNVLAHEELETDGSSAA